MATLHFLLGPAGLNHKGRRRKCDANQTLLVLSKLTRWSNTFWLMMGSQQPPNNRVNTAAAEAAALGLEILHLQPSAVTSWMSSR